jgi:hypothetical protein
VALLACLAAMIVWGGSATAYAWSTARQLAEPAGYIEAVLGSAPDDRRSLR